jgi:hypothetical protein
MRTRITYANLTATVALVVALGSGGAYAAGLAKNSVGSKQIKNGAVKAADLKKGALGGAQVKDGSLTGADVDESTLALPASAAVVEGPLTSGDVPLTGGLIATVTYTAPANGFLKLTGSASLGAAATSQYFLVGLTEGSQELASAYWDGGDKDGFVDQRQSLEAVVPVTAGAHTYTLHLFEDVTAGVPASDFVAAQVIAEYYPSGSAQP